jgi:hypothetical protein
MGIFLPEGMQTPPATAATGVTSAPDVEAVDSGVELMQKVFAAAAQRPSAIPDAFMAYLVEYLQTQRLTWPISQITGFSKDIFVPMVAVDTGTEVHYSNTSFAVLPGNVGPVLAGLNDGHYFVIFGASMNATGGDTCYMAVRANSSSSTDSDYLEQQLQDLHSSVSRGVLMTLSNGAGNNQLDAVFRCLLGHDNDRRHSWMIAFKYQNL